MASHTMAVQTEIPTTVRLSEYRKEEKRGIVAIAGIGRKDQKIVVESWIGSEGEIVFESKLCDFKQNYQLPSIMREKNGHTRFSYKYFYIYG